MSTNLGIPYQAPVYKPRITPDQIPPLRTDLLEQELLLQNNQNIPALDTSLQEQALLRQNNRF